MKRFNTVGKCIPSMHYMVNIDRQVESAAKLVRQGNYFCINRGRQYGKTTTLSFLKRKLEAEGFAVFSLSFEGLGDSSFESVEKLSYTSLLLMKRWVDMGAVKNLSLESVGCFAKLDREFSTSISSLFYTDFVYELCRHNRVVLLIDEVDQAGNHIEFVKFLGILRDLYLNRDEISAFQSVVLAGVYDIKNLKLKMRPDDMHQYNSPWNIAVSFNEDMALPADGIADMLEEYSRDHDICFDKTAISQMIYDYTSGYPVLVSRLCEIIDEQGYSWSRDGVLKAVNDILKERNTLFDDMEKKVSQFHGLAEVLKSIIYGGKRVVYNYYDSDISVASMFDFVKNDNGVTAIYCRIFETWLYDLFISKSKNSDN